MPLHFLCVTTSEYCVAVMPKAFNFYFRNSSFETNNYEFSFPIMPTAVCGMWSKLDLLQGAANFD
jgi:hypothetical protein